ncbi:MAG TPA: S9 family peptidase [Phycisphaerae bacterium]|nr:S9 family peptidase [Phycisphaerae bacterium]
MQRLLRLSLLSLAALTGPLALLTGCGESGSKWGGSAVPKDMASTPLVARGILYGNPDKASPQISPDGRHLAYLAEVDGVMNVWVAPLNQLDAAKPVTQDTKRGIRNYQWAYDNEHILYVQDEGGDENWHAYASNLATGKTRDLTPLPGIQARLNGASERLPGELLVAINDRDKEQHDIYRVTIATGERKLVQKNEEGYVGFVPDDDLNIRLALKMTPDGGMDYFKPEGESWTLFTQVPAEDALSTEPHGFDKSGKVLYLNDSRGRDTAALVAWNLDTGEKKVLAADERADIDTVMAHPTEKTVEAARITYDRSRWNILDNRIKSDMQYLSGVSAGDVDVISRSLDDKTWIVAYLMDDGPVRYYHYDRPAKKANFLFTNRRRLEGLPLAKMHPVIIKARDGLNLVCYLSLPVWADKGGKGRPSAPVPLVLNVHGGPWARDQWGLNPTHQWLTNRGYAVLSVNFRGSTGLGKNYTNAGNNEWAGKMHDDLIDAVNWAVAEKIADPAKVAIMGGSYGGYATLVGLTFTPDVFACGVDIVGPSNIITLLNSIPPYWKPMLDMFTSRVGDHRTEEGKKFLEERSPLTHVDKIKKPLLIGQGANDPRVKQAEADQIVKAMSDKNIPVAYVLFPDEGHGFARPENRQAFYAVAEAFLAKHLGGRYEPIGDDFKGSSIQSPHGSTEVPGLAEALPQG